MELKKDESFDRPWLSCVHSLVKLWIISFWRRAFLLARTVRSQREVNKIVLSHRRLPPLWEVDWKFSWIMGLMRVCQSLGDRPQNRTRPPQSKGILKSSQNHHHQNKFYYRFHADGNVFLSLGRQAENRGQKLPALYENPKFHYLVNCSVIVSQLHPSHILTL
jgi:hypothetical protein